MDGYGPFKRDEGTVLIFSIGNDFEAHGPALPKDIDSRVAKALALRVANASGATYCAHIPFSTDMTGDIARYWSPRYLPFKEFAEKTLKFIQYYIKQLVYKPEKIVIINGHGGNTRLLAMIDEYTKRTGITVDVFVPEAVKIPLGYTGEHAYIAEHSLAAHLGVLSYERLNQINEVAGKDPLEALRRWPALAGLGGFIEFGGDRFGVLRQLNHECLEHFKSKRRIEATKELGERIFTAMVSSIREQL
jgi:creatinine amidohydrolase/Fe(II)-dependent formamide hydrolase-like protein